MQPPRPVMLLVNKADLLTEITQITEITKTEWSGDYKNRMKWWLQRQNEVVITKTEWSGDYKNRMKWWLQKQNEVVITKTEWSGDYRNRMTVSAVQWVTLRFQVALNAIKLKYIVLYPTLHCVRLYHITQHIISYHIMSYHIIS